MRRSGLEPRSATLDQHGNGRVGHEADPAVSMRGPRPPPSLHPRFDPGMHPGALAAAPVVAALGALGVNSIDAARM